MVLRARAGAARSRPPAGLRQPAGVARLGVGVGGTAPTVTAWRRLRHGARPFRPSRSSALLRRRGGVHGHARRHGSYFQAVRAASERACERVRTYVCERVRACVRPRRSRGRGRGRGGCVG
jgi:hypothetical protein